MKPGSSWAASDGRLPDVTDWLQLPCLGHPYCLLSNIRIYKQAPKERHIPAYGFNHRDNGTKQIKQMEIMTKMKRIIITVLAAVAAALAAQAQENMETAVDNFVTDAKLVEYIKANTHVETSSDGSGRRLFCNVYEFSLPYSKRSAFNPLRAAFNKDVKTAYRVYTKSAGSTGAGTLAVSYDDDLSKSVTFGANKDHNYSVMLVRDPKAQNYRYAFALVWYDIAADKSLHGYVYHIYSRDPQRAERTPRGADYSVNGLTTVTVKGKKVRIGSKGIEVEGKIFPYSTLTSDAVRKRFAGSEKTAEDTPIKFRGNSIVYVNGTEINVSTLGIAVDGVLIPYSAFIKDNASDWAYGGAEKYDITTGMDFLQRFGNLRASYKNSLQNNSELELQTAFVNKIVQLCREYRKVLSVSERIIVADGVDELKKLTKDKYLSAMLDEARHSLYRK